LFRLKKWPIINGDSEYVTTKIAEIAKEGRFDEFP